MHRLTVLLALMLFNAAVVSAQTTEDYQQLSARLADRASSVLPSQPETAQRLYEKALVANPANVAALLGLGMAFDKQGQPGRSLKYYRHALELEPNNIPALEAQALAFLARDLPDRAAHNQARLVELCGSCNAAIDVAASLRAYRAEKSVAENTEDQGD